MGFAAGFEGEMAEEERGVASPAARSTVERLARAVEEISAVTDRRSAYKKQLCSLSRWVKLLAPMFDELRDSRQRLPDDAASSLAPLLAALASARALFRLAGAGSNIFLVMERDKISKGFSDTFRQIEQALEGISLEELDLSDEVREQVELVLAQIKRAKRRADLTDIELYADLSSVYNSDSQSRTEPAVLLRLAEKLQLVTITDLKQESLALHELVDSGDGRDPGERMEKMSMVLKKIKDFVLTQNPEMGTLTNHTTALSPRTTTVQARSLPDDFRCPISLELMEDPVIVSTGQSYDRSCIEKWIRSGHDTCPKTQQKLLSSSLTPNYALRSLISQWCEASGVQLPSRPTRPSKLSARCLSMECSNIHAILLKLSSPRIDEQRSASAELRQLSKRSPDARRCIAEAGAVPLLASVLSSADPRTQEHAVTALLNLSICEENKARIVSSGTALPGIVHVLRHGSMEARENAAMTIYSLSGVDENKVTIGASGAIPELAKLLKEGNPRGKKDAANALYKLCLYQGNKGKAVRAGLVLTLMEILRDPSGVLMDEAVAIMAGLVGHPEGKVAIGAVGAVPVLVGVIRVGSPRSRENAAAALVHLCRGEQQLAFALECGVVAPLLELASNGTERGKRKAAKLLERMSRYLDLLNEPLSNHGEAGETSVGERGLSVVARRQP